MVIVVLSVIFSLVVCLKGDHIVLIVVSLQDHDHLHVLYRAQPTGHIGHQRWRYQCSHSLLGTSSEQHPGWCLFLSCECEAKVKFCRLRTLNFKWELMFQDFYTVEYSRAVGSGNFEAVPSCTEIRSQRCSISVDSNTYQPGTGFTVRVYAIKGDWRSNPAQDRGNTSM